MSEFLFTSHGDIQNIILFLSQTFHHLYRCNLGRCHLSPMDNICIAFLRDNLHQNKHSLGNRPWLHMGTVHNNFHMRCILQEKIHRPKVNVPFKKFVSFRYRITNLLHCCKCILVSCPSYLEDTVHMHFYNHWTPFCHQCTCNSGIYPLNLRHTSYIRCCIGCIVQFFHSYTLDRCHCPHFLLDILHN